MTAQEPQRDIQRTDPAEPHAQHHPPRHADELSLADLVEALRRRWKIWTAITVIAGALALLFVAWRTPIYSYTATLRIGSIPVYNAGGDVNATPLDAMPNVIAEINRRYAPDAVEQAGTNKSISADRVDNSDMVELSASGPAAMQGTIEHAMTQILAAVIADHRVVLSGYLHQVQLQEESDATGGAQPDGQVAAALKRAVRLLDAPLDADVVARQAQAEHLLQSAEPLLRPTRVIQLPARSGSPIGLSASVIASLALVLGLGGGLVLALLVDAVRRG